MEIPRETPINVSTSSNYHIVYALRLTDELVARLTLASNSSRLQVYLDPEQSTENMLVVNGCKLPLATVAEAQPVDVVHLKSSNGIYPTIKVIGSICEKFSVRQELAQAKMAQIRKQTEDAERIRLSRKTVALEDQPKTLKRKKPIISKSRSLTKVPPPPLPHLPFSTMGASSKAQSYGITPPIATGCAPSERDSQQSWSPVITEHAAMRFGCVDTVLDRPKEGKVIDRKPPTSNLLSSKAADSKSSTCHQLEEEFGRRYREYVALNRWMDNRLAVFNQLQTELATVKSGDIRGQEQIIFRVVVEERRLKDDREYQENMEKLEESCAALMMIKARLSALVKSSS